MGDSELPASRLHHACIAALRSGGNPWIPIPPQGTYFLWPSLSSSLEGSSSSSLPAPRQAWVPPDGRAPSPATSLPVRPVLLRQQGLPALWHPSPTARSPLRRRAAASRRPPRPTARATSASLSRPAPTTSRSPSFLA